VIILISCGGGCIFDSILLKLTLSFEQMLFWFVHRCVGGHQRLWKPTVTFWLPRAKTNHISFNRTRRGLPVLSQFFGEDHRREFFTSAHVRDQLTSVTIGQLVMRRLPPS